MCVPVHVCMWLYLQIYVMLVIFEENILPDKKHHTAQHAHAHTCVHVLSALAKRVPYSTSTTSTKSSQADGSNERSAEIIQ